MLVVRRLTAEELPWANERYAEIHFVPSAMEDFIVVATLEGVKVGIGRLVAVDANSAELGGIYVLPPYRGQQVARALVNFLLGASHYRRLYCVPFAHLDGFYRGFGFEPVPNDHAIPDSIARKLQWCQCKYASAVTLLVRNVE